MHERPGQNGVPTHIEGHLAGLPVQCRLSCTGERPFRTDDGIEALPVARAVNSKKADSDPAPQSRAKRAVSSINALRMPGSVIECPESPMTTSFASGQARCRSHADRIGHTTS